MCLRIFVSKVCVQDVNHSFLDLSLSVPGSLRGRQTTIGRVQKYFGDSPKGCRAMKNQGVRKELLHDAACPDY